ncbi:MAG: signal peptidase II [Xanthomonadales bacterium]|nr:signal peptidase II [Xanthomonadales bacterium]
MRLSARLPWLFLWVAVAGLVLVADHHTKQMAEDALTLYRPVPITDWLNMTLAHNRGAAFSMLADAGGWQRWLFSGLAIGISALLFGWLIRLRAGDWRNGLALALLIGGALGNLVDRLTLGYVIDFIDVHAAGYHWPAFNIADAAITSGVILLLIDAVIDWRRERAERAAERAAGQD